MLFVLNLLTDTPYILRILVSLGTILLINRYTRNLPLGVAVGTIVLILWCGHTTASAARVMEDFLITRDIWLLLTVVLLVIWLSMQLAEAGIMKELVDTTRRRLSRQPAMAVLPAVIGFLPMPGGAAFSAPMVSACDEEQNVHTLTKGRVNYWFRHVWEYWWPLYPGVLLAIEQSGLGLGQFMLIQLPLCLMAIAIGYVFLLRNVKDSPIAPQFNDLTEQGEQHPPPLGSVFWEFLCLASPILVVIGTYAAVRVMLPVVYTTNRYLPMAIGIAIAMLFVQTRCPLPLSTWKHILCARKTLALAGLVFLISVYGAFIEGPLPDGVLLMTRVKEEFLEAGISPLAVIVTIPFFCGLATGLAVGFVGTSFPIVFSLMGPEGFPATAVLYVTVLAYGFGYIGMLLSPVHVCLVVTNEHFRTSLLQSLRGLLMPAACMGIMITGYAVFLWALF